MSNYFLSIYIKSEFLENRENNPKILARIFFILTNCMYQNVYFIVFLLWISLIMRNIILLNFYVSYIVCHNSCIKRILGFIKTTINTFLQFFKIFVKSFFPSFFSFWGTRKLHPLHVNIFSRLWKDVSTTDV